jgi:quercetin dioxygenase-like cupin family protein
MSRAGPSLTSSTLLPFLLNNNLICEGYLKGKAIQKHKIGTSDLYVLNRCEKLAAHVILSEATDLGILFPSKCGDASPALQDQHEIVDLFRRTGGMKNMDIKRSGSQPSSRGPGEYFTGTVRIDSLFQANAPARARGASVTFEPGARTAWHTHPLGQALIVTAGRGLAQRWGGSIEEIQPGDVVWIPPGEKHWHGATAGTAMTHIAIQEALEGKVVDWMEKVSDEQYRS